MPEIATFLASHPEFGRPATPRNQTSWAEGKLQRVDMDTGKSLAFYEMNGRITTVWDRSAGGDGELLWGKPYERPAFVPVESKATSDLPAYKLADVVNQRVGGRIGEVIIPSLSRTSPAQRREAVARAIAEKEGLQEVVLYATEEAMRADSSASYAEQHPGAMKGYLGSLRGGKFIPAEALYP